MESLENLEKINNTHTKSSIKFIGPHLDKFLVIINELLNIPFATSDNKFRQAVYPYQIIGGMGLLFMNGVYPTGKKINTSDIDVEIAPLVSLTGKEATPIGVYESVSPPNRAVFPYLVSKKGKTAGKVYKVHDAYVEYISFLSYHLKILLQRYYDTFFSEVDAELKPVDPRLDPETLHEIPELSYNFGKLHVSVIFNINFISKIQIVINHKDKIEHIVELIFFKSVPSYFYPGIENINPFIISGTPITPPYDLLKQNIEAILSRIYKKELFDTGYLKKQDADSRSDIIRMNYKIKESIFRFSILLEVNSLYLRSIDTTSASIVRNTIIQALYYFMFELNKKTYTSQLVVGLLYEAFSSNIEILNLIFQGRFEHFKTLIVTLSTKLIAPTAANNTFTPVIRGVKAKNVVIANTPKLSGYFNVLNNGNNDDTILKEAVVSFVNVEKPLPKKVLEENIDKLIEDALRKNKEESEIEYTLINCVVINEPACIERSNEVEIRINNPNGSPNTILRRHRTNLKTILNFINTKTPDFLFIYIMPSRIYSYYEIEESLASKIIYEEPSFYHIYVFIELLDIFLNDSLTIDKIANYYDYYLMTLEQLKNNQMLTTTYIEEKISECDPTYVKTQFDKKLTQNVINKLKSITSTIIVTLLWNLIEKYNLKKIFPTIDDLHALFQKYKNKTISNTQLFGYLLLIRGSILNRVITSNYKESVYLFIPHRFVGTMYLNDAQVGVYLYQLLEAFHRVQFRYANFPKPSFNKLLDTININPTNYKDNTNDVCLDYNANMIINILDLENYNDKQKGLVNYVFKTFNSILLNDVGFLFNIDTIIKNPDLRTQMTELQKAIREAQKNANMSINSDNKSGNKNILLASNPELAALLIDGVKKKSKNKITAYFAANPDFKTELNIAENTDSFLRILDIITSDPRHISRIKALYPRYTRFIYKPKAGGSRKTRKAK
jgi:hypothetical protein